MNIDYIDPLSNSWNRMKKALFQPFDITKWFVVGFTAFLAGLLDGHGGGSGNSHGKWNHDFSDITRFPNIAWDWLMDNQGWFTLVIFGIILLFAFIILLTWLSSRGKFMFLDNVVHDRAKVTKPWYDFRKHGNSLFLWRLIFGLICFAVIILFIVQFFIIAAQFHDDDFSAAPIMTIVGLAFLAFIVFVVTAYISLFLSDFIVPIMYKNNITATQAWHNFLPLLSKHWMSFLLYGLLVFMLWIFIVIFIILAGIFTCCLGFLLLIIPYIGSVVLLPISYTLRAFGPEFLKQFGSDFDIFPQSEDVIVQD